MDCIRLGNNSFASHDIKPDVNGVESDVDLFFFSFDKLLTGYLRLCFCLFFLLSFKIRRVEILIRWRKVLYRRIPDYDNIHRRIILLIGTWADSTIQGWRMWNQLFLITVSSKTIRALAIILWFYWPFLLSLDCYN